MFRKRIVLFFPLFLALTFFAHGQCPSGSLTPTPPSDLTPTGPGNTQSHTQMWGGEYATVSVINSTSYTFTSCGTTYDSQITIHDHGSGTPLFFGEAGCGDDVDVDWVASFTGVIRVQIHQFNCTANATNSNLNVTNNGSLPVEWLSFAGNNEGDHIQLQWTTVQEVAASHFVIERADAYGSLEMIGFVEAEGDADTQQNYSFMDEKPLEGNNYYRLKEISINGAARYHQEVVEVYYASDPVTHFEAAFPNPASDVLHVHADLDPSKSSSVSVFDLQGRLLYSASDVSGAFRLQHSIAVDQYRPGVYLVQLRQGETRLSKRVVIGK